MNDVDPAIGEPPQALLLAMEQLISGERSIAEFRDDMLNILYEKPAIAQAVRGLVDDYARRGLVPEQIHRLLTRDIDKATNEDLPTTPTEFTYSGEETDTFGQGQDRQHVTASKAKSTPRPIAVGSLLRDRFEIVGRASGGSMGVVYKAIDRRLAEAEGGQPNVAIKVLAPDYAGHGSAMRALQQEAAKGRYLNHPNIVRFLDLDRCDDQVFLVMEWLDGRSLSDILNEQPGKPMPAGQALEIIAAVGQALAHAHKLGVTHADVKPGNVMVLPGGGVKLLDFGISRARGDLAGKAVSFDSSFLQAATPAYASPQVLAGQAARPIDDVYSLASMAYRLFSGQRVFRDKSAREALENQWRPARIDTLDAKQWRALERALALPQADRTPSVDAFLEEMGLVSETADSRALAAWRWPIAGVVGLTLLAGLALWSPRFSVEQPESPTPSTALGQSSRSAPQAVENDARATPPPDIPFEVTDVRFIPNLPPAAITLALPAPGAAARSSIAELRLIEDAGASIIRLTRSDAAQPLTVSLVRQPVAESLGLLLAGSLRVVPEIVRFEAGQTSADVTVENLPDEQVEPDNDVRYTLVNTEDDRTLAEVSLQLNDDDRQRIASELPPDTAGFALDELTVREDAAAVRLTVWRFNARAGEFQIPILIEDLGATPGEDYIMNSDASVRFESGQSVTTLYLLLVSDDLAEPVESLRLSIAGEGDWPGVNRSATVRILDVSAASATE